MNVNIFIQARMSSKRFPGKMLTPVLGKPLIDHIAEAALGAKHDVMILTSNEVSDNPLAEHCNAMGYNVFRGPLNNVFLRFQDALNEYPCDYVVRLCGDSPLLNTELLKCFIQIAIQEQCDFLSNTIGKTFPKGQSIEIMKAAIIEDLDASKLTPEQQEHVTPYFHEHSANYKTISIDSRVNLRHVNMCIDTPDDLERIGAGVEPFLFDKDKLCVTNL